MRTALNEVYQYDDLGQLTSVDRGGAAYQDWSLDGMGNWSSLDSAGQATQTREVNAANEITSASGIATPHYDAAGNLVDDGVRKYVFDAWNRQVEVKKEDGTSLATYEFDGRNQRIEKTVTAAGGGGVSGTTTDYFYNEKWQVLEERKTVGTGSPTATQYVWDLSYIDTPVVRFLDANGDGDFGDANERLYYTTDANHNVTALVNTSGQVVERYVYDAYGKTSVCYGNDGVGTEWSPRTAGGRNSTATPGLDSAYSNEILYAGYRQDPETLILSTSGGTTVVAAQANYHVRAREYITHLAVFGGRDPVAADQNLYRYCNSNPVQLTDPFGLCTDGEARATSATWQVKGVAVVVTTGAGDIDGANDNTDLLDLLKKLGNGFGKSIQVWAEGLGKASTGTFQLLDVHLYLVVDVNYKYEYCKCNKWVKPWFDPNYLIENHRIKVAAYSWPVGGVTVNDDQINKFLEKAWKSLKNEASKFSINDAISGVKQAIIKDLTCKQGNKSGTVPIEPVLIK